MISLDERLAFSHRIEAIILANLPEGEAFALLMAPSDGSSAACVGSNMMDPSDLVALLESAAMSFGGGDRDGEEWKP